MGRRAATGAIGVSDVPPRKRPVQREHELTRAIRVFVRDAIDVPTSAYQFFVFDSAQKATDNQRARMVSRGVVVGCPDTLLFVVGLKPIWCELKWGVGKMSDDQKRLLDKLDLMDHATACLKSVERYCMYLQACGVPLRPNAALIAADLDLKVAARIAKAEQRLTVPGRASKPSPRFTFGKRAAARAHSKGML